MDSITYAPPSAQADDEPGAATDARRATSAALQLEYERQRRVWRWLHGLPGPTAPPQRGDLARLWPSEAWCEDVLVGGVEPQCECGGPQSPQDRR